MRCLNLLSLRSCSSTTTRIGQSRSYRPRIEKLEIRCVPSTVTNLNDSGAGSLRQAIIDASPGDTIDFMSGLTGTITLTSAVLTIDKDLTISGPGATVLTVSGNATFEVFNVVTGNVTISDLTVAHGSAFNGAGIANAGSLTLSNDTVSNNAAVNFGGAIYNNAGSLTVDNCTLDGNSAMGNGGAIYSTGPLAVQNNTIMSNNTANASGAGIYYTDQGDMSTIDAVTLTNNTAVGAGGAIYNSGTLMIRNGSALAHNIAQGSFTSGGAIFNSGTLTVADSTLSANSATNDIMGGGAIQNVGMGVLTVSGSLLSDNSDFLIGGAIANIGDNSVLMLTNSQVISNSAGSAAGIWNRGHSMVIVNSVISHNSTSAGFGVGGGISSAGVFTISNSTISYNSAQYGGGIAASPAVSGSIIDSCTISYNSVGTDAQGGGINATGPIMITNSTISNNIANGDGVHANTGQGGGIYGSDQQLTIISSTISGNTASGPGTDHSGGGIYSESNVTIKNTIVAMNSAPTGPDILQAFQSTLSSEGHNLIGDGTGSGPWQSSDLVGTSGDPIDPLLEPLGDYGGPTQTQRPMPSSPAVDAGDNNGAPDLDQRGYSRFPAGDEFVDIGSVELQPNERGPHNSPRSQDNGNRVVGAALVQLQPLDRIAEDLEGIGTKISITNKEAVQTNGGTESGNSLHADWRQGFDVGAVAYYQALLFDHSDRSAGTGFISLSELFAEANAFGSQTLSDADWWLIVS